jgi:hypothetical protein
MGEGRSLGDATQPRQTDLVQHDDGRLPGGSDDVHAAGNGPQIEDTGPAGNQDLVGRGRGLGGRSLRQIVLQLHSAWKQDSPNSLQIRSYVIETIGFFIGDPGL